LNFPDSFFYGPELEEPTEESASFRALTKMSAGQRDMAVAQGAIAVLFSRWLEKRFELPLPAPARFKALFAESRHTN
jgi:hypothetical protein